MPKPPPSPPIMIQGPQNPPNPPMFGEAPTKKANRKPMTPSFLGSEVTPTAQQRGGNTLLGQA